MCQLQRVLTRLKDIPLLLHVCVCHPLRELSIKSQPSPIFLHQKSPAVSDQMPSGSPKPALIAIKLWHNTFSRADYVHLSWTGNNCEIREISFQQFAKLFITFPAANQDHQPHNSWRAQGCIFCEFLGSWVIFDKFLKSSKTPDT